VLAQFGVAFVLGTRKRTWVISVVLGTLGDWLEFLHQIIQDCLTSGQSAISGTHLGSLKFSCLVQVHKSFCSILLALAPWFLW
jgi:F0F1-type ATP synthase assembly protein I